MKKKLAMLLLVAGILTMATGCGENKETEKTEKEDRVEAIVNKDGKIVAADVDNIEEYVTLGEYKNLEVSEEPKQEVSEEMLENNIHYLLLKNFKPEEVKEDRAVEQDDTVNIDYTGYKDGEAFEGGEAKGADLRIGSGDFIPGFEEGIIGHKKGEEFTIDLTFPEEYPAKELQGKAVEFKVKINKISAPPVLNDQWVKDNTEYKNVKEFKKAQKEAMQATLDSDYESKVKADLFSLVVENSKINKFPEELIEDAKVVVREQLNAMYQMQIGISFDDYAKDQKLTEEEINKGLEESAQQYLTQNMIVQAIMEAENMEYTKKKYEKEKEKYALSSGFPDVATMETYAGEEQIRDNVLWNAVCEVIKSSATIKEIK